MDEEKWIYVCTGRDAIFSRLLLTVILKIIMCISVCFSIYEITQTGEIIIILWLRLQFGLKAIEIIISYFNINNVIQFYILYFLTQRRWSALTYLI